MLNEKEQTKEASTLWNCFTTSTHTLGDNILGQLTASSVEPTRDRVSGGKKKHKEEGILKERRERFEAKESKENLVEDSWEAYKAFLAIKARANGPVGCEKKKKKKKKKKGELEKRGESRVHFRKEDLGGEEIWQPCSSKKKSCVWLRRKSEAKADVKKRTLIYQIWSINVS